MVPIEALFKKRKGKRKKKRHSQGLVQHEVPNRWPNKELVVGLGWLEIL